jgi:hypothetical protein
MSSFSDLNKFKPNCSGNKSRSFEKLMKIVFRILVFLVPFQTFCQQDFFRGNENDDLYYSCHSNNKRVLCRFTEYGKKIDIKADFGGLIEYAEPTKGTLFGRKDSSIYKSTDAGLTFTPIAIPHNRIYNIFGGIINGECIVNTCTLANGVVKNEQIYKSYDNGLTQTLVKDSAYYLFRGHIGSVSGEIYSDLLLDESRFLCHSLDFGATFDTIPYDPSIFQQTGRKLGAICPGTSAGELYLVTSTGTCPINDFYIYRSLDFGKTWNLQSEESFPCGDIMRYSCGREAGTFYILHEKESSSAQFLTLEIYASSDSGRTFNTYEHLIAHSLSVPEKDSSQAFSVRPNPAKSDCTIEYLLKNNGNIRLNISAIEGKSSIILLNTYQSAGVNSYKLDCSNYIPGVYLVTLIGDNGLQSSCRLVISK